MLLFVDSERLDYKGCTQSPATVIISYDLRSCGTQDVLDTCILLQHSCNAVGSCSISEIQRFNTSSISKQCGDCGAIL